MMLSCASRRSRRRPLLRSRRQAAMLRLLVHFIELAESAARVRCRAGADRRTRRDAAPTRMGEDVPERRARAARRTRAPGRGSVRDPGGPEHAGKAEASPMRPRVSVHDAATRLEGPLLFMRRTLEVGLNEAVIVTGRDGAQRLGRIATIDDGTRHDRDARSDGRTRPCRHGRPLPRRTDRLRSRARSARACFQRHRPGHRRRPAAVGRKSAPHRRHVR